MSTSGQQRIVPDDYEPPAGLATDDFWLEPLGPEHNESDLEAWTSSISHIQATPGFAGRDWPVKALSLEENLADLVEHAEDFEARRGFAYTVLDPTSRGVIGCVYFYPPRREGFDVDVSSWVRASRASLDRALYDLVNEWLAAAWPWSSPDYAPR
ncbi:MAG: N-acetyltransferase [Acidimicrobiales bacterium]